MMFSVIVQMIFNLLMTVLIEVTVALILKVRNGYDIVLIVLINCVTNPILNFLMNGFIYFVSFENLAVNTLLILLEITVIISEGLFFCKNINCGKINPFLFSLILNGSSFATGEIITIIVR